MINCQTCGKFLTKERAQEAMKECIRCSKVEPYAAHIVYPHKTGAFVQPVSREQKQNMQRLDRRAVKTSTRKASGSNSWDRWLKTYKENKDSLDKQRVSYSGNTPAFQAGAVGSIPSTRSIKSNALETYRKHGYWKAIDKVDNLFLEGTISLLQKGAVNSYLSLIKIQNKQAQRIILSGKVS